MKFSMKIILLLFIPSLLMANGSSTGGVVMNNGQLSVELDTQATPDAIVDLDFGSLIIKNQSVFEGNLEIFNFKDQGLGTNGIAAIILNAENSLKVSPFAVINNSFSGNVVTAIKKYDPKVSAVKLLSDYSINKPDLSKSVLEGLK